MKEREVDAYIEMYQKGIPARAIARKFKRDTSTILDHLRRRKVLIRTVKEAMKIGMAKDYIKHNTHKIPASSKNLTLEKAYVLGVSCGDGWLWYKPGECYQIGLGVIDEEFRDYFRDCLFKVYNVRASKELAKENNEKCNVQYVTRLCSKAACDDLKSIGDEFKTVVWEVPDIIKRADIKIQAKFVQGFADSEGGVDVEERRVNLTSTNKEGLEQVQELINNFKIRSTIQKSKRETSKDCYNLRIQDRKSLELFSKHIGFIIKRKQKDLEKCLKNYKMWTIPHKESAKLVPQMKELRAQGLTYEEIGKRLGIGTATVWVNTNKNPERLTP